MRDKKNSDRLVATTPPAPAVQFPDDETAQTVLTPIRTTYQQASAYVTQQQTLADACQRDIDRLQQEIDRLQQEIGTRRTQIDTRELERQAALQQVQRGQNVMKAAADTLALLGAPVPPPNGELSHDPDAALARFQTAHDELQTGGTR